MQRALPGSGLQISKDHMHPFQLLGVISKDEDVVFLRFILLQVLYQQIKLPVECRLRDGRKLISSFSPLEKTGFAAYFNNMPLLYLLFNSICSSGKIFCISILSYLRYLLLCLFLLKLRMWKLH
jgi:hypothetical protein